MHVHTYTHLNSHTYIHAYTCRTHNMQKRHNLTTGADRYGFFLQPGSAVLFYVFVSFFQLGGCDIPALRCTELEPAPFRNSTLFTSYHGCLRMNTHLPAVVWWAVEPLIEGVWSKVLHERPVNICVYNSLAWKKRPRNLRDPPRGIANL